MRIALGIEYDGSAFAGWQLQKNRLTIQECMEKALSKVADEPIRIMAAGRTDAGVHALEQVAHFESRARRDERAWLLGTNTHLPDAVRVIWARRVSEAFHARYSAIARFYRYSILNRTMRSALLRKQMTWFYHPLDAGRMQAAADYLIGEHDFSSFRAKECQSKSPYRRMYLIQVYRRGDRVIIDLVANAFLHHMVRDIAGVLMEVGMGKQAPVWAQQVLAARDRKMGGVTAPPDGLYLGGICYPERFAMPKHPVFNRLPVDAKRFD